MVKIAKATRIRTYSMFDIAPRLAHATSSRYPNSVRRGVYNPRARPEDRPNAAPRCQVPQGQTCAPEQQLDGPKASREELCSKAHTNGVFSKGVGVKHARANE